MYLILNIKLKNTIIETERLASFFLFSLNKNDTKTKF